MPEEKQETKLEVQPEVKKEDLVTRVSHVKSEEKKDDTTFNVNDIDNIKDLQAKEYAEKAYKSLQGDYTKKYQALAEERRDWEARKAESDKWTKERLQVALKDPDFVAVAQDVANQTQDDYSALSEVEKKRLQNAENITKQIYQQNTELLKIQQDEKNKTKYADYDSQAVDILTADLLKGKVQATREHLYKVLNYENAVKKAYELGLQDKKVDNVEKINSMSADGMTVQAQEGVLDKEKGESDKNWFVRNALNRVIKSKEGGQIRK